MGEKRFLEARAARIARRVEALCRRRAPGCRAVATVNGFGGSFDLSVGPRGAVPDERVWARGLDVGELEGEAALERLARFLEVWIVPPAAAASHGMRRLARSAPAGDARAAAGSG